MVDWYNYYADIDIVCMKEGEEVSKRRVRVTVSLRSDLVSLLKYIAEMNSRSVSNEIETRLAASLYPQTQQAVKPITANEAQK